MELDSYIDCHLHFHSPDMTDEIIKKIILKEAPTLQTFYENPNDHSPLLGLLDALKCKKAWIINYESPEVMGYTLETNDWVAKFCEGSGGMLVPVGSVHPGKHEDAAKIFRDYVESGMIKGLKVHGPHQLLKPNAYVNGLESQRKLYQLAEELQFPVIFHTGTSIFPKARSKFGNPMFLEDILIDFPDMVVIMAHGGRPFWVREAEFIMAKFQHHNLYMDLAGIPPKMIVNYFPRFHRFAHKSIFGSDYPSPGVPGSRENAEAIAQLPLEESIIKKILYENAEKLIPA